MSKERITCRTHCPTWNSEDKDCEIYGEHHFTPRTCPHYNKELKQEMTDKLKPGYHYAIVNDCEAIFEKYKDLKYPYCHGNCCTEYKYLAPVPSYTELQNMNKAVNQAMAANIKLVEQMKQLKELLKEWVQFEIEENPNDFTVMSERMSELANKTKEVLK